MLTDEELTTRLSAAFQESVPELTYAGPVPQARRGVTGLATTSVLVAAAALVLTPAALQHDDGRAPDAGTGTGGHHATPGTHAVHTLDIAGLHLSDASVDGDLGPIYLVGGDQLVIPPDAEKVDLGLRVDVYFAAHPVGDDPQVYVTYRSCPDTDDPCTSPPPRHVYGILAPGWSRQQLTEFLEHPVQSERSLHHHR